MKLTKTLATVGLALGIGLTGLVPATAGDAPSKSYTKREKQKVTRVCLEEARATVDVDIKWREQQNVKQLQELAAPRGGLLGV